MTKKARGDIPHPVVPRHASAEGPLSLRLGVTGRLGETGRVETPRLKPRGDKKGAFGVTKKSASG